MKFVVAVVGRPRDASLAGAIREYETRAARYWPLEIREVREDTGRAGSSDIVREREGSRLLAAIPPRVQICACEVNGRAVSSEQFAGWLQDHRERARDVAIIIGGAFGLGDAIMAQASETLALASWTLPHELARLVLAEQLYRAGTIIRGEPYHK